MLGRGAGGHARGQRSRVSWPCTVDGYEVARDLAALDRPSHDDFTKALLIDACVLIAIAKTRGQWAEANCGASRRLLFRGPGRWHLQKDDEACCAQSHEAALCHMDHDSSARENAVQCNGAGIERHVRIVSAATAERRRAFGAIDTFGRRERIPARAAGTAFWHVCRVCHAGVRLSRRPAAGDRCAAGWASIILNECRSLD